MDFHIRLRTAHRRLARPAHPSCPHPGDERRKLSARHQQEGTAAIGPGAKPKPENAKRRRPRHRNIIRHGSTKINRASQPFSLNPTGTLSRRPLAHFVSAIDRSQPTKLFEAPKCYMTTFAPILISFSFRL